MSITVYFKEAREIRKIENHQKIEFKVDESAFFEYEVTNDDVKNSALLL